MLYMDAIHTSSERYNIIHVTAKDAENGYQRLSLPGLIIVRHLERPRKVT